MMKNLKIYNNIKKNIKYKLALVGLVGTLAASTLAGCGKNNKNNYSLETNIEALSEDKELTSVDEYLLESEIANLDKEYIDAYNNGDIRKCNEKISEISTLILKALTAEGYNIDFNKIKDFKVLGLIAKNYLKGEEIEISETEYGIEFNYDNNTYRIETVDKNSLARKICVIARAGMHNQLVSEEKVTDNDYFKLPNAYETLKETIYSTLNYKNKKHSKIYVDAVGEETKGYKFDGYFTLNNDKKKEKAIIEALKEYENNNSTVKEQTNKLPKKLKK